MAGTLANDLPDVPDVLEEDGTLDEDGSEAEVRVMGVIPPLEVLAIVEATGRNLGEAVGESVRGVCGCEATSEEEVMIIVIWGDSSR